MTSSRTNPGSRNIQKKQFDAVHLLLSSQRPSDIWKGINQARQWLNEDPEDRDVYGLLLDAVDKNRDIREQVRNLLLDMMKRESQKAVEAFQLLPSSVDHLLADADDAFYAVEYERAIQLYRQVLKLDPENSRAKTHLAEARKESPVASEVNPELPRDAVQYYRRARSYIAAKDFSTAMKMLGAAVESAKGRGMQYLEAEKLYASIQELAIAESYIDKAATALQNRQWGSAWDLYNKALFFYPQNQVLKAELTSIDCFMRANLLLDTLSETPSDMRDQKSKLIQINSLLQQAESSRALPLNLLKEVRRRYDKYQGSISKSNSYSSKIWLIIIFLLVIILSIAMFITWKGYI